MRKLVFFLLLLSIGCLKDNDNAGRYNDEFVGYYCGEMTEEGSRSSYNTPLWKSKTNSNQVGMEYFLVPDTAWFTLNGYHITLNKQSYSATEHTSAGPCVFLHNNRNNLYS